MRPKSKIYTPERDYEHPCPFQKGVLPSTCPHHCQEICQSCVSTRLYYWTFTINTRIVSTYLQFQLATIVPIFCCKVSPSMPSSCLSSCSVSCILRRNNIVVKSAILLIFWHSHLLPVYRPSQSAIHCDNMCLVHCCPLSSSKQSSLLTKSIPTENVQPNFLLPQSYATPTPYAPVFPHTTVHTIGSSIVVWGDKSLHTYSKTRWGYRAVRERPTLWSLLTNLCGRTTYRGDCRACWWTPNGARGKTVFGTSNKWENLASRAASLSFLFLVFAIFCDMSHNMYIF